VASQLGEPVDPPCPDFSRFLSGEQALLTALARVENVGAAAYCTGVSCQEARKG